MVQNGFMRGESFILKGKAGDQRREPDRMIQEQPVDGFYIAATLSQTERKSGEGETERTKVGPW